MASEVDFDEGSETKGSMWVLEQKLDQPMDEEAGRLKNMYREKVKKQKKKTKSLKVLALSHVCVDLMLITFIYVDFALDLTGSLQLTFSYSFLVHVLYFFSILHPHVSGYAILLGRFMRLTIRSELATIDCC